MMSRASLLRREEARKDALARQLAWEELSPQQQLDCLDARLGKGVGAVKQRAKILAKMEAPVKPVKGQKNVRDKSA